MNQLKLKWLNAVGGEVYTWGWKECVPSGKVIGDPSTSLSIEKDAFEKQSLLLTEQGIAVWSLASDIQSLIFKLHRLTC